MAFIKSGILSTIGNTPVIKLERVFPGSPLQLYAKLEIFNPGGSIKDRPAFEMISRALASGELSEGSTVIESSSGNMAIGLAQVCRYYGLDLVVVVDPKINSHTLKILKVYGAQIEKITEADDTGNYLNTRLNRVQELLEILPSSYWPNQYANQANPAAHYQTMAEINDAMPHPPDYLFASTSTCGTIMGCANYIRENKFHTKLVAVDAEGSVIFGTQAADRMVPGHGAGRSSELLDKSMIDHVVHISDEESIEGCYRLLNREAILAGGSSGAVISAIDKLKPTIPDGSSCALLLPDSGERYLDTIYNEKWIQKHFSSARNLQSLLLGDKGDSITAGGIVTHSKISDDKDSEIKKVAIIGGGPKGMYGFERLAAQFSENPPDCKVEIHIYNKSTRFGAGDIYRPDQPDYLLINNPIGDINMWIDETPGVVAPEKLSLTKWLQVKESLDVSVNDYVSRGIVGKYLENGFEQIAVNLPKNINGEYFVGEVVDIQPEGETYTIQITGRAGNNLSLPHQYSNILLATGHPNAILTSLEKEYLKFSERNNSLAYVPFVYPVESRLNCIKPDSKVAVKGIGLTFIDTVLAFTEGRGGTFKQGSHSKYVYQPSGKEPEVIYPFSRSGLPMIPRGPAPKNAPPLKFFTPEALQKMKDQSPEGKLDFRAQIKPLLYREIKFAFYEIQLRNYGFKNDLRACSTFAEAEHYIERFHEKNVSVDLFDPDLLLYPHKTQFFQGSRSYNDKLTAYLQFFLEEARKGELESPWAAASAVWRKATPVFGSYYAFGGLKPESQLYFDIKFRRLLNRATFGPPIKSIAKIVSLIKDNILDFSMAKDPKIKMDKDENLFMLSFDKAGLKKGIECLVNARIPKVSLDDNQSALYHNLRRRGMIRTYANKSGSNSYQPGCAEISRDGFLINQEGTVNPSIAMTGTPTEGITFDNDALSRTRNNFVSKWAKCVQKSFAQFSLNPQSS